MFLTSMGETYHYNVLYYFLGWDDDGKLNFETCDFPTAFSNISPEQLAGLKGEYQCGCKVCIFIYRSNTEQIKSCAYQTS